MKSKPTITKPSAPQSEAPVRLSPQAIAAVAHARQLADAERYEEATELLNKTGFREMRSPEFLKRTLAAEKAKKASTDPKRAALLNEAAAHFYSVQRCKAWEAIDRVVPAATCFELLLLVTTARTGYERGRKNMRRLTHKSAKSLAAKLRAEIRNSDATPGLTQKERETLTSVLEKVIAGGPAELSKYGKAMPVRVEGKDPALTFVVRGIHDTLVSFAIPDLTSVIADLTSAALQQHVTARDVRNALKGRRGE